MSATDQGKVGLVVTYLEDEAPPCNGSIARYADQGQKVHVLFMTNVFSAHADTGEQAAAARRPNGPWRPGAATASGWPVPRPSRSCATFNPLSRRAEPAVWFRRDGLPDRYP